MDNPKQLRSSDKICI